MVATNKQTLTVVLEVPEGYELTGEFREPLKGDTFLMYGDRGGITTGSRVFARPILRKVWQPPKWLPGGRWVWKFDGRWWASQTEPRPAEADKYLGEFVSNDDNEVDVANLAMLLGVTFNAPPVNKILISHGSTSKVSHAPPEETPDPYRQRYMRKAEGTH